MKTAPGGRRAITIALALAMFMAALEMTVVATAMPTVVGELGGIHRYAWVFTGYMVASTVMVPIFGKLSDLYGRKPIILIGIGVFVVSSAACGAAATMNQLIAFRILQGLGAGAMQPIAVTIIGDLYSVAERGKVQGVFAGIWGISALVGPTLGGLIVAVTTWRWIFLLNLLPGALALAVVATRYREQIVRRPRTLDLPGAALLAAGVVALLLGVQGEQHRWALWIVPPALLAFILAERRAKDAILPPVLFSMRPVAVANATALLYSATMFGAVTYVPLYVQGVLGGSPTQAGGMITPMLVAWPLCATIGGRLLPRVGYRALVIPGLALAAVGAVALPWVLGPSSSQPLVWISLAALGAGMGFANTPLLIATQTSVGWELRGAATASNMFFRTIGGTLGVGVMGGVLSAALARVPGLPADAADELLGPDHGLGLPPDLLARAGAALSEGLHVNLWIGAACAVLAFLVALAFPHLPITGHPGEAELPLSHEAAAARPAG